MESEMETFYGKVFWVGEKKGWYSVGVSGQEKVFMALGSKSPTFKGQQISKGMMVRGTAEYGQFGLNMKSLEILGEASVAKPSYGQESSFKPKSTGGKGDAFEAGVTAGAALNNAVLMYVNDKIEYEQIGKQALEIAKLSIALKKQVASVLAGEPEQPKAKPKPKPAPKEFDTGNFDEDIPF